MVPTGQQCQGGAAVAKVPIFMVPTGQQCQGGATVAKVSKFKHYKFRDIQKTDFRILFCHKNGTQQEICTKF